MSKKSLSLVLIILLMSTIVSQSFALSVGDTKVVGGDSIDLKSMDRYCNQLLGAATAKDGSVFVAILTEAFKVNAIGTIYGGTMMMLKSQMMEDYIYFNSVRSNMIQNGYETVKIVYHLEYKKSTIGREPFFGWWPTSRSAVYYK
ncbi:hypothetical protein [Fusibacter sp. 3D3]|uniref:hypothetical protein n=1 Tax=Fusibacter sp. 3D3 TaxID=1048380 RepID=UPI000853B935|nr:hypothetical protein [Fusibacter sp. 3D3]